MTERKYEKKDNFKGISYHYGLPSEESSEILARIKRTVEVKVKIVEGRRAWERDNIKYNLS